ncbi:MAG: transporter substrate-binding domain-containing protein [Pararhodobacter sp.]|nr:transporter substrate-binding domain-containing protein [Pararhodobacter sp.]
MNALRLGYPDPFPPFCESTSAGARGRFVTALAAALPAGQAIEWLPGKLDTLPRWLAEGRIDAIAPKAVTPARADEFAFSQPLMQTAAALFGPARCPPPALHAAGSARIATPRQGPLVAIITRHAPATQLVITADYAETLAAVLAGTADFGALNADAGAELAQRQHPGCFSPPGPCFAPLGLAVATLPGDPGSVLARLGLHPLHLA